MPDKREYEAYIKKHGRSRSCVDNEKFARKAKNNNLDWELCEIEILTDTSIPMTERALKLGRSYMACGMKLDQLKSRKPLPLKERKSKEMRMYEKMLE